VGIDRVTPHGTLARRNATAGEGAGLVGMKAFPLKGKGVTGKHWGQELGEKEGPPEGIGAKRISKPNCRQAPVLATGGLEVARKK